MPLSLPAHQSLNEDTAIECFKAHKMAAKKESSGQTTGKESITSNQLRGAGLP